MKEQFLSGQQAEFELTSISKHSKLDGEKAMDEGSAEFLKGHPQEGPKRAQEPIRSIHPEFVPRGADEEDLSQPRRSDFAQTLGSLGINSGETDPAKMDPLSRQLYESIDHSKGPTKAQLKDREIQFQGNSSPNGEPQQARTEKKDHETEEIPKNYRGPIGGGTPSVTNVDIDGVYRTMEHVTPDKNGLEILWRKVEQGFGALTPSDREIYEKIKGNSLAEADAGNFGQAKNILVDMLDKLDEAQKAAWREEEELRQQRAMEEHAMIEKERKEEYSRRNKEGREEERLVNPQSMEQLAKTIEARFPGLSETYPLLYREDVVNEEGEIIHHKDEINEANFIWWIRQRMMYFHGNNPDEERNFFQDVHVWASYYRPISLGDMLDDKERFFRSSEFDEQGRRMDAEGYVIDSDTHERLKDEKGKDIRGVGKMYGELANQALLEAWLFGGDRNDDFNYRLMAYSADELQKALLRMFYFNRGTKTVYGNSNLAHIYNLPLDFSREHLLEEKTERKMDDIKIGQAMRIIQRAYHNLSDFEELKKILGENAPLLTKEGITEELKVFRGKQKRLTEDEVNDLLYVDKEHDGRYRIIDRATGVLRPAGLAYVINIFNEQQKDSRIVDMVRDLMKKSVRKCFFELDEKGEIVLKYKEGMTEEEVAHLTPEERREREEERRKVEKCKGAMDYAETWAFARTHWSFSAARNDTGAIGFDAGTKITESRPYRLRQAQARRGGIYGNPYSLGGFKSFAMDFFDGVKDNRDNTVSEIIKSEAPLDNVEFDENTMRQYQGNHLQAFNIFQYVIESNELNFDKLVQVDAWGRIVTVDTQRANVVFDKVFKAFRYAYSTYAQLDYSKQIRTWDTDEKGGNPHWEDLYVPEVLWGKEVLKDFLADLKKEGKIKITDDIYDKKGHLTKAAAEACQENRSVIWKEAIKYLITTEIWSHRDLKSPYSRYEFEDMEKVYRYLESIKADFSFDENDFKNTKPAGRFFSEKDIERMRKKTGTGFLKMASIELAGGITRGGLVGFFDALKHLIGSALKNVD